MLTKLTVRNFKRFEEVEIELDSPVVLLGPNNSGKTTAMQTLALWGLGLKRWNEKRDGLKAPERRPGVTIGRRDLAAIPVPDAKALWRQLHTRGSSTADGRLRTANVRIEVIVEGRTNGNRWVCGLEFDYANPESIYCRPLRTTDGQPPARMPIPPEAASSDAVLLPPMSGLAATEQLLQPGAVNVLIGEGRTAEVLRNLCFQIYELRPQAWQALVDQIHRLFGVRLEPPAYISGRGEIVMTYREDGVPLDLSAAGRGLQQTLLLLAYMYTKPGAVLMLDEPDAHLEILRQRQIYELVGAAARENDNQLIIATHSEALLNAAAPNDRVIAFVGRPHPLDGQRQEVLNALSEFGFEHYVQAEETGWVLYLEGATDLPILRSFAQRLQHCNALEALERPFIHTVGNQPDKVRRHFHSIRIAVPNLRGVALFDNLRSSRLELDPVVSLMWRRNEIENYLCTAATLEAYAAANAQLDPPQPLFQAQESERRIELMRTSIAEVESALHTLGQDSPWSAGIKASDDVLVPIFRTYYEKLGEYNAMPKKHLAQLAAFIPDDEIDPEITEKLDAIAAAAQSASPPGLP